VRAVLQNSIFHVGMPRRQSKTSRSVWLCVRHRPRADGEQGPNTSLRSPCAMICSTLERALRVWCLLSRNEESARTLFDLAAGADALCKATKWLSLIEE
jgi:hypothetical protein